MSKISLRVWMIIIPFTLISIQGCLDMYPIEFKAGALAFGGAFVAILAAVLGHEHDK